jgi:hypothetical protein
MLPFAPTTRGMIMIFLCIASLGVSLANINLAATITSAGFSAVLAASLIMSILSIRKIDVWRGPGSDCCSGEKITLPVFLRNRSRLTRQAFVIREKLLFTENTFGNISVEALKPGETRLVKREFNAVKRGSYQLEKIYLVGGDPAGLFRRVKTFKIPEDIIVYPEMDNITWMPLFVKNKIQASTTGRPIGISGIGEEFFGVREYRRSDSMRFINWKSTARQGKLMVREFEAHASVTLVILLDGEKKKAGFYKPLKNNYEYLVKTAASICNYACGMYCRIIFISPNGKTGETVILKGTGIGLKREIMNLLSTIEASGTSLDSLMDTAENVVPPNSILYCLTLSENSKLSSRFDFMLSRGIDIRWLCAPLENFIDLPAYKPQIPDVFSNYTEVNPKLLNYNSNIAQVLTYG